MTASLSRQARRRRLEPSPRRTVLAVIPLVRLTNQYSIRAMPNLPDAAGAIKIIISGNTNNQPWVNTLHYGGMSGIPTTADLDALAASVSSAWATNIAPILPNNVTKTGVQAIDIARRDGATGYSTAQDSGVLTSSAVLPVNVAVCVSEHVQYRWRGGHPRFYLPPPAYSSIQNGNQLTEVALGNANTAVNGFFTQLNTVTVASASPKISCVRFYNENALLAVPMVLPVTRFTVKQRLDSQRRRLGKEIT